MSADHSIPDVVLERYRLSELPADEAARVKALAEHDARLHQRLEALDRSDAEFAARDLSRQLEDGVHQRLADRAETDDWRQTTGRRRRQAALWALPVVAAAVIVFAIMPRGAVRPGPIPTPAADDGDRIKGLRPALALYRRTADGSETLADGAVARVGDLLRVGYRAAGRPYGVILSVDGRGSVTVHLPKAASLAVPLRRDTTVLLDQAYELDDAPKWERFYFITGNGPFAVAPIVDAARQVAASSNGSQAAALPLPPGLEQSSVAIQKETRP